MRTAEALPLLPQVRRAAPEFRSFGVVADQQAFVIAHIHSTRNGIEGARAGSYKKHSWRRATAWGSARKLSRPYPDVCHRAAVMGSLPRSRPEKASAKAVTCVSDLERQRTVVARPARDSRRLSGSTDADRGTCAFRSSCSQIISDSLGFG